jgi:hypothetical protein
MTTAVARPKWMPPDDIELLEQTGRLLELRAARSSAQEVFDRAWARDLSACRVELEDRLLAGDNKAPRELPS